MSEKTEKPTPKKIQDAREEGQVPVSRDLARLATVVVLGELAFGVEKLWREGMLGLIDLSVMRIGQPFLPALTEMLVAAGLFLLACFAALGLAGCVVGVAAFWGQFGIVVSSKAVTPKFDRLNPASGIKQIFSARKAFELLTTLGKTGLIIWIMTILIRDQLPTILALSGGTPRDIYYGFVSILHTVFRISLGACACFAVADFLAQHHFHTKSLMMSMEDIKREHKESEGDPMLKGVRRQLAREWANSAPAAKTEQANAVVVNPTHFAIALLYDDACEVPVVLAKGRDETAQAMIARARECGIPIIRHVWLARSLYATARPDTVIPKSSYAAVAHVYAAIQLLAESGQEAETIELEAWGDPPAD